MGAPFKRQGRSLRGIDCLGLLLSVAEDLGLYDRRGAFFLRSDHVVYPRVPDPRLIQNICAERLELVAGSPIPGDVLTFRSACERAHLAIASSIGPSLGMIHAAEMRPLCRVVEHVIDDKWRWRILNVFRIPLQRFS